MAIVFRDARLIVNGKDLSVYTPSVSINYASEILDQTAMGDTTRSKLGGLYDWSLDLELHYASDTGGPEAVLWGLVGTSACWELRPRNSCAAPTNPEYSGVGILDGFNYGGNVGALLVAKGKVAPVSALTRASSS